MNNIKRPPKVEQVKANFDAAFSQQDITVTAGIIIRNREGLVMRACTYPLRRTRDPTTVEAKVYLQAIIFGEEMEGDALIVIKKLKSDLADRSKIGNIINEIQRKRFNFGNLYFEFTPRKTNKAAHALATRGYNLISQSYWTEEVPMEVEPTVVNDQRRFLNR
ncbi:reverse transcriptase [Gossypium australe]|uniref:Reverse transcriptase n=1 Tax=Gossypium australe TaxID=47621 RepID=A0A5B6W8E4_9ROSI|nr:reverse transcriptase [Gossypium australe]